MNISILILTLNEEANLPYCFDKLDWCDDVIVLGDTEQIELLKSYLAAN